MKVLHLFYEINFSGAEIMYAGAAPLFQSNGVEMYAFSTGVRFGDYVSEFKKNNIKTFHHPLKYGGMNVSLNTLRFYFKLYRFIKKENIDVLHSHRSDKLIMIAFIARLAKVKTIITIHSVYKHRKLTFPYGFIKRLISRRVLNVKFHAIGQSVYEHEISYYHNKSVRINNWFDANLFFPAETDAEKKAMRAKLKINENTFVLISVGGCSKIKNHSDILRALKLLDDSFDFLYLHLGTGTDEGEEKELAGSLALGNKVRFFGNKHNVRDYLIASDVYIMPSLFEGLGNAGLEALACGLPSILYNTYGLRDLIIDNDSGFLIEPDYKILASKILFLKEYPTVAEKMGKQAVEYVNSEYSVLKSVPQIIKLYREEVN